MRRPVKSFFSCRVRFWLLLRGLLRTWGSVLLCDFCWHASAFARTARFMSFFTPFVAVTPRCELFHGTGFILDSSQVNPLLDRAHIGPQSWFLFQRTVRNVVKDSGDRKL